MYAQRNPNPPPSTSHGSRTHTVTTTDASASASASASAAGPSSSSGPAAESHHAPTILRLRGAPPVERRSVQWSEDTVDNERLNRKKSKVCCIYHRPRAVDESSSESSSDSSSGSDSDSDLNDADRPRRALHHHASKPSRDGHDDSHGDRNGKGKGKAPRKPSPNAYERQPKPRNLKGKSIAS